MLGPVRKILGPVGRGEVAGRIGAWWDGRDYVPPPPAEPSEVESEASGGRDPSAVQREGTELPPSSTIVTKPQTKSQMRIKALQLAWGDQRFGPGSDALDTWLLDLMFETANQSGAIGFIGADPAVMNACRARTDRSLFAAEWRAGCLDAEKKLVKGVVISAADIDRPLCFPDRKIESMLSIDAFAFADHKPGLAGRAHKALSGTGRWVLIDIVRNTPKAPSAAFASAWAEPQLPMADEIDAILKATGFVSVRREDATAMVVKAARKGIAGLGASLEEAMKAGMTGADGAVILQEVAWEIQSWQARVRALAGGALSAHIWVADKDPVLRGGGASALMGQSDSEAKQAAPTAEAVATDPKAAAAPKVEVDESGPIVAPPVGGKAKKKDDKADQASIDALFD